MNPRRILSVTEPGNAGVFYYMRSILQWVMDHRPETRLDLAYSSRRDCPELYDLVRTIQARGGETVDLRVGNAPAPGDFSALMRIWKLVRKTRPNIIHAHSSKAGALVRFLGLLPGFPPIVYTPNAYYGMGKSGQIPAIVFNTIETIVGRIGTTINGSGDERRFAIKDLRIPKRRAVFIHHGINLKKFSPASDTERNELRSQFNIPTGIPLIVTVGRDAYQKNYPPLYEALERMLASPNPGFIFAHAGSGAQNLASSLSPNSRASVRSFEHLGNVHELVRASNAMVMTSRYESPCYAVLEGLASGLKMFLAQTIGMAGQARLGFDQISWIQPNEEDKKFSANIEAQLAGWLQTNALMPDPRQAARARLWFDDNTQIMKTVRLFDHVAAA
jgi:glycosyltransferase involved in cell wall biosynthesis